MKITTIGIDLAKEVFAIHGVDERGHAVLRKQLKRSEMAKFFVNLEPCLIGMEACGRCRSDLRSREQAEHAIRGEEDTGNRRFCRPTVHGKVL